MKAPRLRTALLVLGLMLAPTAFAEWVSGEIRRLDPDRQRMTIRHGEIKHLDMPPMTMVFQVRDPALFQDLQASDQIEFKVVLEGSRYLVTEIRKQHK